MCLCQCFCISNVTDLRWPDLRWPDLRWPVLETKAPTMEGRSQCHWVLRWPVGFETASVEIL